LGDDPIDGEVESVELHRNAPNMRPAIVAANVSWIRRIGASG
jgi:hypothetical protein